PECRAHVLQDVHGDTRALKLTALGQVFDQRHLRLLVIAGHVGQLIIRYEVRQPFVLIAEGVREGGDVCPTELIASGTTEVVAGNNRAIVEEDRTHLAETPQAGSESDNVATPDVLFVIFKTIDGDEVLAKNRGTFPNHFTHACSFHQSR